MTDLKVAIETAIQFAEEILGPERTKEIRVEELEQSTLTILGDCDPQFRAPEVHDAWLITLSMFRHDPHNPESHLLSPMWGRDYKVVTIDRKTGEVRAMKMQKQ